MMTKLDEQEAAKQDKNGGETTTESKKEPINNHFKLKSQKKPHSVIGSS